MRSFMTFAALVTLAVASLTVASTPVSAGSTGFSATGDYCVASTGQDFTKGLVHLTQTDTALAGTYGHGGTLDGKLHGTAASAKWTDQRGNGWMKLQFTPAGRNFDGQWGLKGKPASGTFKATRIAAGTTNASACP